MKYKTTQNFEDEVGKIPLIIGYCLMKTSESTMTQNLHQSETKILPRIIIVISTKNLIFLICVISTIPGGLLMQDKP